MRKHLYVDNTDLSTFGVYCSGQGTFGAPEKEITTYTVPGRDGLVLGVNERMENIRVVYPCFIYTNFAENMKNLRSFLLSRSGYVKINDDYDTTHFRMGFFEAGIDPDVTTKNDAGSFNLVFNCQPQRWLNSGETVIERLITSTTTLPIVNETQFVAKPFVRIYGYGNLTFYYEDGTRITIGIARNYNTDSGNEYIDIDCETMDCFVGDANYSNYVSFTAGASQFGVDAPTLKPGTTTVRVLSGNHITRVQITPRWWEV